jgi:hypothetical protein
MRFRRPFRSGVSNSVALYGALSMAAYIPNRKRLLLAAERSRYTDEIDS